MTTLKPLFVAVVLLSGCATGGEPKPTVAKKSLYERLGGKDAITLVVAETATRIGADQRINARFANVDMAHLKSALVDQICEATGGPCKYAGKPMKLAHAGQKIGDDEFTALVEDLKGALDKYKVPEPEQKELIGALATMKGDVVNQ